MKSTSDYAFPGIDFGADSAGEPPALSNSNNPFVELGVKDERQSKLRLVFKNGNRCFLPYAYMLRTEYHTNGIITIYTSEKQIIIKGRGLDYLEEHLYINQVKSIRESKVAMDNGVGRVFIKSIEIMERNNG